MPDVNPKHVAVTFEISEGPQIFVDHVPAKPDVFFLSVMKQLVADGAQRVETSMERGLIFCNPDGSPLKPDSVSATISLRFRRLKIEKPKGNALHILRHTMASHMLASGVPLPVVSATYSP